MGNELKCGSVIVNPPIGVEIESGKISINVEGEKSKMFIEVGNATLGELEKLKLFIEGVYKLGYSDASSYLMNK